MKGKKLREEEEKNWKLKVESARLGEDQKP
jgi:hypothetical protein